LSENELKALVHFLEGGAYANQKLSEIVREHLPDDVTPSGPPPASERIQRARAVNRDQQRLIRNFGKGVREALGPENQAEMTKRGSDNV